MEKKVVEHLNLPRRTHKDPYSLWSIRKGPSIHISKTCCVPLSISKHYKDRVISDVIDMDACYILLGRPCQYDVESTLRSRDNVVLFSWNSRRIAMALVSFSSTPNVKHMNCLSLTRNE